MSAEFCGRAECCNIAKNDHCALARANHVFRTDQKRIRTENMVMDKDKDSARV